MRLRPLIFFLWIWVLLAAFIREGDLRAYGLQLAGAEALVNRGALELGNSSLPELNPQGDVFVHNSSLHPAKQPGQFYWSAVAYAALKSFGVSFEDRFITAAAWTTWLSGTLAAALLALGTLLVLERLAPSREQLNLTLATLTILATPMWAYSGVAHHDLMAMCFVTWALWAWLTGHVLGASFLMGFSSFFSLLVAPGVLGFSALAFWLARRDRMVLPKLFMGFGFGLSPNLLYNWRTFGSPLKPANIAGDYADTFFRPSMASVAEKLNIYFGSGQLSLWVYAPLVGLALAIGARQLLSHTQSRELLNFKFAFLTPIVIYILGIETIGHCQFGGRYLIPLYALSFLALANCSYRTIAALSPIAIWSVASNFAGAQSGTMRCDLSHFLNLQYWKSEIATDVFPARGLALWLAIGGLTLLLGYSYSSHERLMRSWYPRLTK